MVVHTSIFLFSMYKRYIAEKGNKSMMANTFKGFLKNPLLTLGIPYWTLITSEILIVSIEV